jgi:hypothetical protein
MRISIPITRNPDVEADEGWAEEDIREAMLDHVNHRMMSELAGYYPEFSFGLAVVEDD